MSNQNNGDTHILSETKIAKTEWTNGRKSPFAWIITSKMCINDILQTIFRFTQFIQFGECMPKNQKTWIKANRHIHTERETYKVTHSSIYSLLLCCMPKTFHFIFDSKRLWFRAEIVHLKFQLGRIPGNIFHAFHCSFFVCVYFTFDWRFYWNLCYEWNDGVWYLKAQIVCTNISD